MSIPKFLLSYIPKAFLKSGIDASALYMRLVKEASESVDKILSIKKSFKDYNESEPLFTDVLQSVISETGIFNLSDSRNAMINKAILNVLNVISKNYPDEDYVTTLQIAIGITRKEKTKINRLNIKETSKEKLTAHINSDYKIDLKDYDEEEGEWVDNSKYGSKLELIYLLYGENALRNYLQNDGYSTKVVNFIIPSIIERAEKNRGKYSSYLDRFAEADRIRMDVLNQGLIAPEKLIKKPKRLLSQDQIAERNRKKALNKQKRLREQREYQTKFKK